MRNQNPYAKSICLCLVFISLSISLITSAQVRPFEGFGAVTQGGAGQPVVRVTNLNATGPGSLAAAMGSNRRIVFDVAGTINNFRYDAFNLVNLTIDGNTAPAPGITINNNNNGSTFALEGPNVHDIIITNLRLRGNPGIDNITVVDGSYNIILDHISVSGSHDGGIDVTAGSHDVTVQYCLFGPGASDWSGSMLIAYTPTRNVSIHHNLFSSATPNGVGERNPLIHSSNGSPGTNMMADFRNNLVYNWGRNNGTGSGYGTGVDYQGTAMIVNNYYRSNADAGRAVDLDADPTAGSGAGAYVFGNFSGNTGVNPNTLSNHAIWSIPAVAAVVTQDPCTAAAIVRAEAGAQPRDAVDQAIINAITLTGCTTGPVNLPPVANAGADISLTLPTILTTLSGSGSDPDGTIASYSWSRVSGPTTFSLLTPLSAVTTLTGLIQGTYVFRLTVTDNNGATATDDVTVSVTGLLNSPPTANAGTDITLTLPVNNTTLTGSGADTDGTIASYAWSRVSGPTTFTMGTPNAATTTLTGLVQGTYVFRLTVTDNNGASGTDNITVLVNPAPNQAPVANAGNNIVMTLPANSTTLNGSGTDADGTIASYLWSRVSGPATFTLGTPAAATTSLTGLVAGTYVFRLRVTDNSGATATDDVTVTVNPAANQAPAANAGTNIVITLPTNSTTLNGTGTDADGTIASYAWTRISGPATYTIETPATATTNISGLIQGVYVFRLTVTDNNGATATDDVNVTVNASVAGNQAPIANAGTNIVISLPVNTATLNGSGSVDLDGSIATYAWAYVSGPATYTITSPGAATTTLTGLVQGTYVFRLTVTDNLGATDMDNVMVTVNAAANQAPSASAGNNIVITLPVNSTTLNGSATDLDGTIASYSWSRLSGPTTFTITSPATASTGLTGLVQGTYVFTLTVTDNNGATATDDVTVTVNPAVIANIPPVARAGNDLIMTLPANSATLNGSTSTDADGTIVSYSWSRVSGPTTHTFTSPGSAATGVNNLTQGVYVFRLTVTDDDGATSTDDITVTVNAAVNQPPTANAGNDITITLPVNSTTVTGSGTDPDGTIVSYSWARISGPTSFSMGTPGLASSTVTALVQGVYVFRLTVTDNNGATATDNVTITVNAATPGNTPPTANAGNDITITLPVNSTTLAGSGTDPGGSIVSYAWTRVSGPATYILTSASTASTGLTNLVQGVYQFRLTVTDNFGATASDIVQVTVLASPAVNQPPVARTNADVVLTLPATSTPLSAITSTDPDGIIVNYRWTQVSGPNTAVFTYTTLANTEVSGLTIGQYVFQIEVTDDDGAVSTKTVQVTVNNANGQGLYLNVYPNPTSGLVNIQLYQNGNGKVKVAVFDATRRLVYVGMVDKNQVVLNTTVDATNYNGGAYIIQLELPNGERYSKQFIKM